MLAYHASGGPLVWTVKLFEPCGVLQMNQYIITVKGFPSFMKWPNFTEWLFGAVLLLTLQLAIGLIFYVPLVLLTANDSSRFSWRSPAQLAVVLVGAAIVPLIVFRWSRFFVRVASRRLLRQRRSD